MTGVLILGKAYACARHTLSSRLWKGSCMFDTLNSGGRHGALRARRWLSVTVLLLAGCGGGGGGEDPLALTIAADFATTLGTVPLSGTVSLPDGSERAGGTLTMPLVTCQLGNYKMSWSNAATGATGNAYVLWDCPRDIASWSAQGIGLAVGANRVTVTMTDSRRIAQASITITRQ